MEGVEDNRAGRGARSGRSTGWACSVCAPASSKVPASGGQLAHPHRVEPVRRVAYRVEDTRVGQKTDLDRLVLRVWTDGSTEPRDALDQAVDIMRAQLNVFSGDVTELEPAKVPVMTIPTKPAADDVPTGPEPVLMSLESLELSSRVLHSLQEEGIDSVNALLALSERDLKKVGGVGEKSLEEIKERLAATGLKLKE